MLTHFSRTPNRRKLSKLSTEELTAVPASEALWVKRSLGKKMPERWKREESLYDGLATTRYTRQGNFTRLRAEGS